VLLKIVYELTWRTLGLVVVLVRGDRAIAAEMLVLRHENAVLRRQAGRVRYEPVDRAWFAADSTMSCAARSGYWLAAARTRPRSSTPSQ
jgi:hypothetical protein